MITNIATSDVPRTNIITLLARILEHTSVTGDDFRLNFLSWHLRMLHHGVSTKTPNRIRGGSVWYNWFSSVDWSLPIALNHTHSSVLVRAQLISITLACNASMSILSDERQLGDQSLQALHILHKNKDLVRNGYTVIKSFYFWPLKILTYGEIYCRGPSIWSARETLGTS